MNEEPRAIEESNTSPAGGETLINEAGGSPLQGRGSPRFFLHTTIVLLSVIAVWSFLWPLYRAFFNIEIDRNEGWNAYFADAAMGRMALYPAADQLITNNYPPLSFYIVGAFGRVVGDSVLAGRLLSLAAVIGIAWAIFLSIRRLGGGRAAGWIGTVFFVATISRFCTRYVGMDDPQLLAQAVMAFGFAAFLRAWRVDRGYLGPILVMAAAGFIKHNIFAMPLTAFIWLSFHQPRESAKCFGIALAAIALGFAACRIYFGPDFFLNMFFPREYSWWSALDALGPLKRFDVALGSFFLVGSARWRDPGIRLCALLIFLALFADLFERTGAGVDVNSEFDLLIGAAIGLGLAFSHLAALPAALQRVMGVPLWRAALILAICFRLLPTKRLDTVKPVRLVFDRSLRTEIAIREAAMAASVKAVQAIPGDVMCPNLICYRSGKPFVIDDYNAGQRIAKHALPEDAVAVRLQIRTLTKVETDPRADWDKPLEGSRRAGGSEGVSRERSQRE